MSYFNFKCYSKVKILIEKNSASNQLISKVFFSDIKNLIGQKLTFRSILKAQDFSYCSINFKKSYDIRDQHTEICQFVNTKKETNTKNVFQIPDGYPRHKKLTHDEIQSEVVENDYNPSIY